MSIEGVAAFGVEEFIVLVAQLGCVPINGLDCFAAASVKSRKATDVELFEVGLISDMGFLNGVPPMYIIELLLRSAYFEMVNSTPFDGH